MSQVAWSLCLTVCVWELNRSRFRWDGLTRVGLKNDALDWDQGPHGKGQFWGFLSYPTHFLWSLYFGVCSKRIIESLVATVAANCTALDWSVSHYIVPCEKSSRLRCGLSSKFFDHLLLYHHRLAVFGLLNHLYRLCNDLRMKFNNSK